jgi:hypothetical protein
MSKKNKRHDITNYKKRERYMETFRGLQIAECKAINEVADRMI